MKYRFIKGLLVTNPNQERPEPTAAELRPIKRPLVILESPYAGNVKANRRYARECVKDSLERGEAPIASHLLYTRRGILDDRIPQEREIGIKAGLAWLQVADKQVFYIDKGYSEGMKAAKEAGIKAGIPIEERQIKMNQRTKNHKQ